LAPRASADSSILDYNPQGKLGSVRDVPGAAGEQSVAPPSGEQGVAPPAGEQGAAPPAGEEEKNGAAPQMQFPSGSGAWSDPRTWYEPGEVVVGNPPPDFDLAVQAFGFRVVEKTHLQSLGFDVWRLKVPDGVSVPEAISRLAQRFPGLLIDANHRYQGSVGPVRQGSRPGSEPRALMGWNTNDASCGDGIRIGMVDTPVDIGHEALQGQKIVTRSFIRSDRPPAPAYHGTAIATMLVGRSSSQPTSSRSPIRASRWRTSWRCSRR
jgi:hypothetical protein